MPVVPFHEVQFPVNYAQGASGGPIYSTRVTVADSGAEQRVQMWSRGRLRFDVGYVDDPAGMAAILTFFRARKGRAFNFRFKDWSDYKAVNEVCVHISGNNVQLYKTYTDAAGSEARIIKKPVSGTVVMKDNGSTIASTVDYTTGIVTLGDAGWQAGHVYTWTGQFDVPVRFDVDQLTFTQDNVGRRTIGSLPVVEVLI